MPSPFIRACVLAAAAATTTGCVVAPDRTTSSNSSGTITIDNASAYVLTEVRVAPVDQVDWGPNMLPDVLYPNEKLTVAVRCDNYDVLVTDNRSRQCILGNIDLCYANSYWTIYNATLHNCGF